MEILALSDTKAKLTPKINRIPSASLIECDHPASSISNSDYVIAHHRRQPLIIDDDIRIELEHYYVPPHYQAYLSHILIPHGNIVDRVEKLAYDIHHDYNGETIHIMCVLKGDI
jgi:hypoxanthine phosphoribosyltransferase